MGRAPCCDKATVKKGPWSPEEDAVLKAYIEEHGTGGNWIALPHKIGLKRCGKSCRLRWLNYLRPNIKHGDFTPEEDSVICSLYISIGSRWSIIAAQLPGRTDNDVKNYWNTKLKKRLLGRRKDRDHRQSAGGGGGGGGSEQTVDDGGERCAQALSASAMERIQLCMQLQNNPFAAVQRGPLLWPPPASHAAAATQSNASNSGGGGVTVAEPGQSLSGSLSMDDHLPAGQLDGAAAMDAGLASSPSSAEHSDVITIEAELQKLLYGDGSRGRDAATAAAIDVDIVAGGVAQQSGDVDWPWSYDDQGSKSPVSCWDFAADTTAVFHDYASVYDI